MTDTHLTQAQRDALHALGITDDEIPFFSPEEAERAIRNLTPELVQKARNGGGAPPEPPNVKCDQERESLSEAPSKPWDESSIPTEESHSQASTEPEPEPEQRTGISSAFLEKLRPGGPWVLTAIVPDGKPTTITVYTADQVEAFVCKYNGKRNLYYAVNPTRTAMSKKAAKTDIAAIEDIPFDLDPADGETPEAAKARYLAQLNGAFEPNSTAVIDSGNGLNGLCRLQERIVLGEPVNGKFSPEDQAKIDDVE